MWLVDVVGWLVIWWHCVGNVIERECVCVRAWERECKGGQKSINSWMPIGSVLCICRCGWVSWSACSDTTGSASFNHLIPLTYTLLWQTVLFILDSQLLVAFCPFYSYSTLHILSCLYIMLPWHEQTAMNHICRCQCDLELQYDQASAWTTVWPGLCSLTSHEMKMSQFFKYLLNIPYIISICIINNKGNYVGYRT